MKPGCLAFTCSDQPPVAMQVLHQRAFEKKVLLFDLIQYLPSDPMLSRPFQLFANNGRITYSQLKRCLVKAYIVF